MSPPRALMLAALAGLPLAAAAADPAGNELAEVVVTAEKTSAPLSKTPISISVISAEQLADQHINDYEGLSRAVPNLSFSSFGGPGQSNIEIRGVSSQAGSATTGIYLDDVPINILNIYSAGATEPRFFDVDRVEVLRGPQGTIYGSGSMGGTLHFVSRAPALDTFEGSVNSSLSSTHGGAMNGELDGVVNLPLIAGEAALRIGGLYEHESGWIDRNDAGTIAAEKINHVNTGVIRATLEWHPTDGLSITPAAFLQRRSVGGQDLFALDLPSYESPTLVPEVARDEYAMTSLTVKYDFGWSDLTSVTGYFWRRDDRNIDGTFYDSVFLGQFLQETYGFGGDAIGALAAPVQFNTNVNQIHEEMRLSSKTGPDDTVSWIAGLFYARTRTGLLDNEYIPGFNATFQATYHDSPLDLLGADFPNDLIYYAFTEFVNTQKAVFGQVNYRPLPHLKVTLGGRYEKSTEDLSFNSLGFFSSGEPFSGSASGSKFTPRVAVSYELGKTTLYASAAEGFRDGGINRPVPEDLCAGDLATLGFAHSPPSYSADSLWSYELGAKGRIGEVVSLSGALFDIRWNNIQTDVLLPTCTFDIKTNIGSAESRGLEFELAMQLDEHLRVNLAGNYTSAKITVPVSVLGVQRGDWVPGVPDYSVSTSIDYTQALSATVKGIANLNAQWTGTSQGVIYHGDPDFQRPAYVVVGGRAGVQWPRLDVSLFVTNLLDQDKIIQRPNIAAVEYGMRVRPRTIGLNASYRF